MKEKANFTPSSLLYSVWPLKAAAFASTALVDSRVGIGRSETFPYSLTSPVSFLPLSLKIDAVQRRESLVSNTSKRELVFSTFLRLSCLRNYLARQLL